MEDKQNGQGRRVSMLVSLFLFQLVRVWRKMETVRDIFGSRSVVFCCICLTNELIIIITIQIKDFFKFVVNILGRIC